MTMPAEREPTLTTDPETGRFVEDTPVTSTPVRSPSVSGSLVVVGVLIILISAWGGIVPFVGPLFGYRATGTTAWTWNLSQAVLGFVPGVVGVLAGLAITSARRRLALGIGRAEVGGAGLAAAVAGAWFVIGPDAWTVLSSQARYFTGTSPFRTLVDELGYSFGPGLILAVCGGGAIGWAVRHRYAAPSAVVGHGLRLHRAPTGD